MKQSQYSILGSNSQRTFNISQGQAKSKILSRYLQRIPCKVNCNYNCNDNFNGLKIPKSVSNYVVVDTTYLLKYHECLEMIDNIGFIITISSLTYIQKTNRKLYFKLKKLFEDPAKSIVLFQNEFHEECFISQRNNEDLLDFTTRQNTVVAQFYFRHLNQNSVVVFLTESIETSLIQHTNLMRRTGNDCPTTVRIMTVKQYLDEFHGDNLSAIELIDSLEAALSAVAVNDDTNALKMNDLKIGIDQDYLPDEVLVASLKAGDFLKGVIRVNKFRSRDEASVILAEGNSSKQLVGLHGEVFIQGQVNRNRAIDGDIVIISILPESQWMCNKLEISDNETSAELAVPVQGDSDSKLSLILSSNKTPTGRVVGIHKRNWRDYVCSFEKSEMNSGQYVLVTPFDRRVPRIRIGISHPDKLIDQRFIVRIDNWAVGSNYPNGHFVEILGPKGDLETETKTLLIEYNLYNRPFTAAQLAELPINTPENPWKMDPKEMSRRRDLRDCLIFSIDPIGCQDIDDALSIRELPNGNIELGVHIADVTYFVSPHSLLDLEARKRSTSIYMADRRFDMLPHVLSGDLCSLWSDVDRFAVSVTWELTPAIEVVSVEYFRSIIRSKYKLHYELAQDIHDNKVGFTEALEQIPELQKIHKNTNNGSEKFKELKKAIIMLQNVASVFKSRRNEGGGLELEGMEVQVKFSDPNRTQLEDLHQKEPLEMHETIAECMIYANHWVAKKCYENYPTRSCLRHHPAPRMDHFVELIHCASTKGFSINFSSNLELGKSLDMAVDKSDPEVNRILRSLATMAMSNAQYFSTGTLKFEDFYHYGLALPTYTHFTSPIRRYADILVHRILLCAIEGVPEDSLLTNSTLAEQCDVMNSQHRQAQLVQRASIELFQAMFFKNKSENDPARYTEGVIVNLRSNGFLVHIPRYGVKGSVFLKKQNNSVAWLNSESETVLDNSKKIYRVEWLLDTDVNIETESYQQSINKVSVIHDLTGENQSYNLFDRVFLRIDASESFAHGLSLHLELIGKLETSDTIDSGKGMIVESVSKEALFQNVREINENNCRKRQYVEDQDIDPISAIAALHSNSSLCHFFRQYKKIKLNVD